uniref:glutathione transferase n=1 Tax=Octactis speculum TaxID=3111310 RepID=A0A7S2DN60_9STRA|mmetsp:Transcript_51604/g.70318  ORF Transcript_51604/g.70318 Transcript_51604/m.70318 type:complete len:563 (+) Transcript_51604:34-1722(+)
MEGPKFEIGYWNIRGLGAPLRLMAEYSEMPYTAKCYDVSEKEGGGWDLSAWFGPKEELKQTNPLMNLPYVKDTDGTIITQSNACFAYLGQKTGLSGSTPLERARCTELLCEAMDLRNSMVSKFYNPSTTIEDLCNLVVKSGSLPKLEASITSGPYFFGCSPTAADFHVFELVDQLTFMLEKIGKDDPSVSPCLREWSYPKLLALRAAMLAEPTCQNYFNGPLAKLPLNNKMACFGATPSGAKWVPGQACEWAETTNAPVRNAAFMFIKPHAVTPAVHNMIEGYLAAKGIRVISSGDISAEEIDEKKLIDQHYYSIASKATILKPAQLNVPGEKFKAQFGLGWEEALATGTVVNAMDACEIFGCDADTLDKAWAACKKAKNLVKFGGGFYCGHVTIGDKSLYVFNGFFMSMRTKFTTPGLKITYFSVDWEASSCSWADFRGALLGPTDPADAPADSLRGLVNAKWEALGLASAPDVGDNGVHASASPFEALAERMNWLGADCASDPFGSALLAAGIPMETIKAWSVDPQVKLPDGSKGSIFDAVEDQDFSECLETLKALFSIA